MARGWLAALTASLSMPAAVGAQEFPDAQTLSNRVLFARADAAAAQRAAERRRIAELDARAAQQAVQLQEQARSVQALGGELETLKEERRLIDLADAFDAALAAGRWAGARALLASEVAVDLGPSSGIGAATIPADTMIVTFERTLPRGALLPRSNQRVSFDADRATVSADGYAWERPGRPTSTLDQRFGRHDYGFARTGEGWRIDRLVFRPASSP